MFGWLKRLLGRGKEDTTEPKPEMSYKEFNVWANERACDGYWGPMTAMACADICIEINGIPWWKREAYWRKEYAGDLIEGLVKPTNRLIHERTGKVIKPI